VKQPVFRPDGSILQDDWVRLCFWVVVLVLTVSTGGARDPDPLAVAAARLCSLEEFLRDFPWTGRQT